MNELKIIATIISKPEHQATLEAMLTPLITETRKESGNISYVAHRDIVISVENNNRLHPLKKV